MLLSFLCGKILGKELSKFLCMVLNKITLDFNLKQMKMLLKTWRKQKVKILGIFMIKQNTTNGTIDISPSVLIGYTFPCHTPCRFIWVNIKENPRLSENF